MFSKGWLPTPTPMVVGGPPLSTGTCKLYKLTVYPGGAYVDGTKALYAKTVKIARPNTPKPATVAGIPASTPKSA